MLHPTRTTRRAARAGSQIGRRLQGSRDRLLNEQVRAGGQGGQRGRDVEMGRGADEDRVRSMPERLVQAGEPLDREVPLEPLHGHRIRVADGHRPAPEGEEVAYVAAADGSAPDDEKPHSRSSGRVPFSDISRRASAMARCAGSSMSMERSRGIRYPTRFGG